MTARLVVNVSLAVLFAASQAAVAADNGAKGAKGAGAKVAYQQAPDALNAGQTPMERSELVFSAAPRGGQEASEQKYAPLAEYLSKVIGKKIVYKYPGTWGAYQGNMQKGAYDLVYDGPHLNGWRVAHLQHNVLAKIPHELVFVALVKKDNSRINSTNQLAGRTVCAHAPPNLGTLTLLSKFDNPARLPVIVAVDGWDNIYKAMMADKCVAAVVPKSVWQRNDKDGTDTKAVFKGESLPNQAFSAGPRISKEDQARIAQALISPAATEVTEKIRAEYNATAFVAPARDEYVHLGDLLRSEWGYN